MVCSITNDFSKQSEVSYQTTFFDQFCGTQKLGEITSGRSIAVTDVAGDTSCKVWSADYSGSEIDNEADGRESVTCSFHRDSVNTASDINFLRDNIVHFYAGFNVFEDSLSEYRIAGAVSRKLEIKMFEETGAVTGLSTAAGAVVLLLATSFNF